MNTTFSSRLALLVLCLSIALNPIPQSANTQFLSPASSFSAHVTWGNGVSREQADQMIKQISNDWLILSKGFPLDSELFKATLAHLEELKEFAPTTLMNLILRNEFPEAKQFRKALKEYLVFLNRDRLGGFNDAFLDEFIKEIFQKLFSGMVFRLSPKNKIPGFLKGSEAVEPGFHIEGSSDEHYLVETVRHRADLLDRSFIRISSKGVLFVGDMGIGIFDRKHFILKGKKTFKGIPDEILRYYKDLDGKKYTFLPVRSSTPLFYWEPRGIDSLVFVEGKKIGEEGVLFSGPKTHLGYSVNKHGKDEERQIDFDFEGVGEFNGKKVYLQENNEVNRPYPRIEIMGGEVYLFREVNKEPLATGVLAYYDVLVNGLVTLDYQPILFHSSGIVDLQLGTRFSPSFLTSRFLHGALESKLVEMAYQGVPEKVTEQAIIEKTHAVAEALDRVVEGVLGEPLSRVERLHRKYFQLSKHYESLKERPHPLYGLRQEIDYETLPELVEVLLESFGNQRGLGFTVEGLWAFFTTSKSDGGKFWVPTQESQKLYAQLDRILDKLYIYSNGHIGRIQVNGKYYYFSFTGYPYSRLKDSVKNDKEVRQESLRTFFELMEELSRVKISDSGRISSSAHRALKELQTLVHGIKNLHLKQFFSFAIYRQLMKHAQAAWYDKHHMMVSEYLDVLKILNVIPVLNKMKKADIPEAIYPELFVLLMTKGGSENRGVLIKRLEAYLVQDPKAPWIATALPLLIDSAVEPEWGVSVIKEASSLMFDYRKPVLNALKKNRVRLNGWENLSSDDMDDVLLPLYREMGLDYVSGVRFLMRLADDSPALSLQATRILVNLFDKDYFDLFYRKKMIKFSQLRDEAIQLLITKSFSKEEEIAVVALEGLRRMQAPHQIIKPFYKAYQQVVHEQTVSPKVLETWHDIVQEQAKIQKSFQEKKAGPKKEREPLLQEEVYRIMEKRLEKGFILTFDDLASDVLKKFPLESDLKIQEYYDLRNGLFRALISFVNSYKADEKRVQILFKRPDEFADFIKVYLEELNGVLPLVDLIDWLEEHTRIEFMVRYFRQYINNTILNLSGSRVAHYNNRDSLYAFSMPIKEMPPRLFSKAQLLYSKYASTEERFNELEFLERSLRLFLKRDNKRQVKSHIQILEGILYLTNVADSPIRLKATEMLVGTYFNEPKSHEFYSPALKSVLSLPLLKGIDPYFVNLREANIIALLHPGISPFLKKPILDELFEQVLADLPQKEEKRVLNAVFLALEDPYLSPLIFSMVVHFLDYLQSISIDTKMRKRLIQRFQELMTDTQVRKVFNKVLKRGLLREVRLMLVLISETNLFKYIHLIDLRSVLNNKNISFLTFKNIVKQVLKQDREDLDILFDLLGRFPNETSNQEYEKFLITGLLPRFFTSTVIEIAIEKLLDSEAADYQALVRVLTHILPAKKSETRAAYRIGNMHLMEAASENGEWRIHGNPQLALQLADELGIPTKLFLQANLYHELAHVLFWIYLGRDWGARVEEAMIQESPDVRDIWKNAKQLFRQEFGYSNEESREELIVKIFESLFVDQEHRVAGIQNKTLAKSLRSVAPILIQTLDLMGLGRLKVKLIKKDGETHKEWLIRTTKAIQKHGLQIDFTHKQHLLESHCTPESSSIEFSL